MSLWSLLWSTMMISVSISQSVEVLEFDEYGNKYIRVTLGSNESDRSRIYELSLARNEYIYMTGSPSIDYKVIHVETNFTFFNNTNAESTDYMLLEPLNTASICSKDTVCKFNLIVTNTQIDSQSIWLRINKNVVVNPDVEYADTIEVRKRRRYGMKIREVDLPILVQLIPNQDHDKMDIDLYGFTEASFTSYYYPNSKERNHVNNYIEQYVITSLDDYYQDSINKYHFFEVYGSTDSDYDDMDYTFTVIVNYEENSLLKRILLIFAFTIAASFIFGIFLSFFCTFRHQILFCLRIRSSPHPNGASKRQIKKLKVVNFSMDMIESGVIEGGQCVICLEEYSKNDKVRILKCNHNFHVHCSDEWLFINSKCPLCQQNIADAMNVHHNSKKDESEIRSEIEMVELEQLPSESSGMLNQLNALSVSEEIIDREY